MSERPRCKTTRKFGVIAATDSLPSRIVRAVCDRPDHDSPKHRGRLLVGNEIVGVIEWEQPI